MKKQFLLLLAALAFSACEHTTGPQNNPITVVPSTRTLFVLDEGNFQTTNSALDAFLFHDSGSKADTIRDLNVLNGLGEGNDVLVVGNHVLVLANGSNSLNILNADSLKLLNSISFGLDGPNKMAIIGPNLLLVTRRKTTSAAIVDLTKKQIVDSIPIGEPSVAVAVLNNKAYITSGGYDPPGHLNILNLSSMKIIRTLWLRNTPEQCVVDSANNQIIIGTAGDYDTVSPALYYVESTSDNIKDSLSIGTPEDDGEVTIGPKHFLVWNKSVYPLGGPTHTLPGAFITSDSLLYKGFYDPEANELYLGEYNFGGASGKVDVFNGTTGEAKWSLTTGIAPAHFAFYH